MLRRWMAAEYKKFWSANTHTRRYLWSLSHRYVDQTESYYKLLQMRKIHVTCKWNVIFVDLRTNTSKQNRMTFIRLLQPATKLFLSTGDISFTKASWGHITFELLLLMFSCSPVANNDSLIQGQWLIRLRKIQFMEMHILCSLLILIRTPSHSCFLSTLFLTAYIT